MQQAQHERFTAYSTADGCSAKDAWPCVQAFSVAAVISFHFFARKAEIVISFHFSATVRIQVAACATQHCQST